MFPCLNQYLAEYKVSCSMAENSVFSEARTSDPQSLVYALTQSHCSAFEFSCLVFLCLDQMILLQCAFHAVGALCTLRKTSIIGLDKHIFLRKIVNIFLPIMFSICFGCSKETSH